MLDLLTSRFSSRFLSRKRRNALTEADFTRIDFKSRQIQSRASFAPGFSLHYPDPPTILRPSAMKGTLLCNDTLRVGYGARTVCNHRSGITVILFLDEWHPSRALAPFSALHGITETKSDSDALHLDFFGSRLNWDACLGLEELGMFSWRLEGEKKLVKSWIGGTVRAGTLASEKLMGFSDTFFEFSFFLMLEKEIP